MQISLSSCLCVCSVVSESSWLKKIFLLKGNWPRKVMRGKFWNLGDYRRWQVWVGKGMSIPWRRQWHPTPVLSPGKSHGRRSLVGYSPWGRKESDTTERLLLRTGLLFISLYTYFFSFHLCDKLWLCFYENFWSFPLRFLNIGAFPFQVYLCIPDTYMPLVRADRKIMTL